MEYLDIWGCEKNELKIDLDKVLANLRKLKRFELKFECQLLIIPRINKQVLQYIEVFQFNFKINDSNEDFLMVLKM